MSRSISRAAWRLVLGVTIAACSGGSGASSDGLGASSGGAAQGALPPGIVGSWYAGQGGTTAPYDPGTGAWGTPTGKGLVYVFEADATYTKAFQSYVSSGGCTTGFTVFESGVASASGSRLTLTPTRGNKKYSDSCAPSLASDDPLSELVTEQLTFRLEPGEDGQGTQLVLMSEEGAASTFRAL